ncbi:MAG: hypothetical protein R3A78_00365 [Polyangiales bacterium]|nr:right-handed parallel beta-helix repeat-containing protein [Myxococcales bacterium]
MRRRGMWRCFAALCALVVAGCDDTEVVTADGGHGHDAASQEDADTGSDGSASMDSSVPWDGTSPTPATTGWEHTGVTLEAYSGPATITADNTVIDGKDITKCLVINAKNVTIKRSRIKCASDYGILQNNGATGLLVEDTEITSTVTGSVNTMVDRAVQLNGGGANLQGLYIHDTIRGVWLASNTTVEDSYIADNFVPEDACGGGCPHTTAIVSFGTAHHVVIRHNTLKAVPVATAALALEGDFGSAEDGVSDDYLIDGNLLATAGGFAFYADGSNLTFINNKFSTEYEENGGIYGHTLAWGTPSYGVDPGELVWDNNTWYDPGGDKDGEIVPEP